MTAGPLFAVGSPATSFVSTGFSLQPIDVFAAKGTYTVSIRYRASSGLILAKNRTLWVETVGTS